MATAAEATILLARPVLTPRPLEDTHLSTLGTETVKLPIQEWGAEILAIGHSLARLVAVRPALPSGVTEQLGGVRVTIGTVKHILGQNDCAPVDTPLVLQGIQAGCIRTAELSVTKKGSDKFESTLRLLTRCSSCQEAIKGHCPLMPTSIALVETR